MQIFQNSIYYKSVVLVVKNKKYLLMALIQTTTHRELNALEQIEKYTHTLERRQRCMAIFTAVGTIVFVASTICTHVRQMLQERKKR